MKSQPTTGIKEHDEQFRKNSNEIKGNTKKLLALQNYLKQQGSNINNKASALNTEQEGAISPTELYEAWKESKSMLALSKQIVVELTDQKEYTAKKIVEFNKLIEEQLKEFKQLLQSQPNNKGMKAKQDKINALTEGTRQLRAIVAELTTEMQNIATNLEQSQTLDQVLNQTYTTISEDPQLHKFLIQQMPVLDKIQTMKDPLKILLDVLNEKKHEELDVDLSDLVLDEKMMQEVNTINKANEELAEKLFNDRMKVDGEIDALNQLINSQESVEAQLQRTVMSNQPENKEEVAKLKEQRDNLQEKLDAIQQARIVAAQSGPHPVILFKKQVEDIDKILQDTLLELKNPATAAHEKISHINKLQAFKASLHYMHFSADVFNKYVEQIDLIAAKIEGQAKEEINRIVSNPDASSDLLKEFYEKNMALMQNPKTPSAQKEKIEQEILQFNAKVQADIALLSAKEYQAKIGVNLDVDSIIAKLKSVSEDAHWLAEFVVTHNLSKSEQNIVDYNNTLRKIAIPFIQILKPDEEKSKSEHKNNDANYSYTFISPEDNKSVWILNQGKNDGNSGKKGNINPPADINKEEKKAQSRFRLNVKRKKPVKQQIETQEALNDHDRLAAVLYRSQEGKLDDQTRNELNRVVQSIHLNKSQVKNELAEVRNDEGEKVRTKLVWVMEQLDSINSKAPNSELVTAIDRKRIAILEKQKNYLENCFIQLNNPKVDQGDRARHLSHEDLLKTAASPTSAIIKKSSPLKFFDSLKPRNKKATSAQVGSKEIKGWRKGG